MAKPLERVQTSVAESSGGGEDLGAQLGPKDLPARRGTESTNTSTRHANRQVVPHSLDEFVHADLGARSSHDGGGHPLTQVGVRHAHDGGVDHGGMGQEYAFDLGRMHLLTARDDHVVGPTGHEQAFVVVEVADIARVDPTIDDGLRSPPV